jgi:hypothetical protein
MNAGDEEAVRGGLEAILSAMAPGRFGCRVRKGRGGSVIGKPVDLEIYHITPPSAAGRSAPPRCWPSLGDS